jgi:hypothetical protein
MRFGTILDALRDQSPGYVASVIYKAGRSIGAPPTSPAKARKQTHGLWHSRLTGTRGAQLATKLGVHWLAPRAGCADTCVWTHSERYPSPLPSS